MNTQKPLSFYTNRISILFNSLFMISAFFIVLFKDNHREIIISLLVALTGSVFLSIVIIASPNQQLSLFHKLLNRNNTE